MAFVRFMAGPSGRGARIVVGAAFIALGLFATSGLPTVVLVAIGGIAVLAGAVNFCLLAPLFRAPVMGGHARRRA